MAYGTSVKYYVVILTDGEETRIPFSYRDDAAYLHRLLELENYHCDMIRVASDETLLIEGKGDFGG